jgi:hypothetical protein
MRQLIKKNVNIISYYKQKIFHTINLVVNTNLLVQEREIMIKEMKKSLKNKFVKYQANFSINNKIKKGDAKKSTHQLMNKLNQNSQNTCYLNTSFEKNSSYLKELEDIIPKTKVIEDDDPNVNITPFNEKFFNSEIQSVTTKSLKVYLLEKVLKLCHIPCE